MANQPKTPVTAFRIPADLKSASTTKASAEGRTLTSVVIEKLEEYVEEKC